MRGHQVDGGRVYFDRRDGLNLLVRSTKTSHERRSAPRSLQIGLLTPCNLACEFCYRDTAAPDRLTAPFLVDLLSQASRWGVLEVAFGGGEPLLFDGFGQLLRDLHATTPLGLNFTTNGTLLTESFLDEVGDAVGEIRVSAYADNDYRRTLALLRGREFGVNWLVTPRNVGLIEPVIHDCLALGAKNVLLLGYKGPDASMHLTAADLHILRKTLQRRVDWPILLDVCWHPLLDGVPQLFARSDCGAADEFLVITPDRAVQPCSFHHQRIPFESFEDLRSIYAELRSQKAPACIGGCTRRSFVERRQPSGVFMWQARASNNSGAYTVLGRFATEEEARDASASLRELATAHMQWLQTHPDFERYDEREEHVPATPPLLEFGRAHKFEWDEGLWWECDEEPDAPPFTAHVLDKTVIIHHPYAMSSGWQNFEMFFSAIGAKASEWCDVADVLVRVTAKGSGEAIAELESYAAIVTADEYDFDAKPPWGKEADDPRLGDNDDRNAEAGYSGKCVVERTDDGVSLLIQFENAFAGALAVEAWLREKGYREIVVRLEADLSETGEDAAARVEPKTGLFGDLRPLAERVAEADEEELAKLAFEFGPESVDRVAEIDKDKLAEYWEPLGRKVGWGLALERAAYTGSRAWLDRIWNQVVSSDAEGDYRFARALRAVLTQDEAVACMRNFMDAAPNRRMKGKRLQECGELEDPRVIDWIEEYAPTSDLDKYAWVARDCGVSWDRIERWYEEGAVELAGACIYALDDEDLPRDFAKLTRKVRRRVRGSLKESLGYLLDRKAKPR